MSMQYPLGGGHLEGQLHFAGPYYARDITHGRVINNLNGSFSSQRPCRAGNNVHLARTGANMHGKSSDNVAQSLPMEEVLYI